MAGHKSCYTMIEPIHLGETRKLARRNFLRSAGVLVSALSCMPTLAAPDNRQGSVHPPERAGQEFDMLRLPNSRSPNRPVPDLRGRSQEFSRCLEQLFICAARLRQEITELPLTEVFSVQVYKEIQAIERLVKRLKSLARS
jgi:hypothetical protein